MFELYRSKLHPECDFLWQRPRRGHVFYSDDYWYEKTRVGHNPLETFMRRLAEEANLMNKQYTNHSIRATCISNLDRFGFEARHITAISSHKSESTIKEYSVKCPENKKREMFQALSTTLHGHQSPSAGSVPAQHKQPTSTITSPEQNTNTAPDLPDFQTVDLFQLDDKDNELLAQILTQTEKDLLEMDQKQNQQNNQPQPQHQIQQTNQPQPQQTNEPQTEINQQNKTLNTTDNKTQKENTDQVL